MRWVPRDDALGECDAKKAQFAFAFSDRHDAVNNQECKAKTMAKVPVLHIRPPTALLDFVPSCQEAREENEQLTEGIKRLRCGRQCTAKRTAAAAHPT